MAYRGTHDLVVADSSGVESVDARSPTATESDRKRVYSDLLRGIRVESSVAFWPEFRAPWGVSVERVCAGCQSLILIARTGRAALRMRPQEQDPRRAELRSATERCDLFRLFQRDLGRFYLVSFYLTADAAVAEQVVLRAFDALAAYPRSVSVIDALKEIAIATVKKQQATPYARLN